MRVHVDLLSSDNPYSEVMCTLCTPLRLKWGSDETGAHFSEGLPTPYIASRGQNPRFTRPFIKEKIYIYTLKTPSAMGAHPCALGGCTKCTSGQSLPELVQRVHIGVVASHALPAYRVGGIVPN